jgi:cytoskeletal protein RodZ
MARRHGKKKTRKKWKLLNLWNLHVLLGILGIVFVLITTIIIQQSQNVSPSSSNNKLNPQHHRFFQEKLLPKNDISSKEVESKQEANKKLLSSSEGQSTLQQPKQSSKRRQQYADWRRLAIELSALSASDVITTLEQKDPFGVRHFEKQLVQLESENHGPISQAK